MHKWTFVFNLDHSFTHDLSHMFINFIPSIIRKTCHWLSFLYLFIWLCRVLVSTCRIFDGMQNLSCSMWDLAPWPGMEPKPPVLGTQSLSHWTTREVLSFLYYKNSQKSNSTKKFAFRNWSRLLKLVSIMKILTWSEKLWVSLGKYPLLTKKVHFLSCLY